MRIYPAILTDSFQVLTDQLSLVKDHPAVEVVHLDVIDGFFADNLTITPLDLNEVELGNIQLDLHLMANEPLDFVYEAVAGVEHTAIRTVIGQIEQMSWQSEFLEEVKKHGWRTGLALNLFTPLESIDEASWDHIDVIQLMAIEAGGQGRTFNPLVLEIIKEARAKIASLGKQVEILIDGGIDLERLPSLAQAGVDSVAIGSEIWQASDPAIELQELLTAAERL
jgi:ribulose-phosphate 3-epimerase